MKKRIGYLMSEFPGQTHTWVWREYQALQELDIEPNLISTKHPPTGIIFHKVER